MAAGMAVLDHVSPKDSFKDVTPILTVQDVSSPHPCAKQQNRGRGQGGISVLPLRIFQEIAASLLLISHWLKPKLHGHM